jgi:cobalt-zinc-cadmium efflux system outer membrane protein
MDSWFDLRSRLRNPQPRKRQHSCRSPRSPRRQWALSLVLSTLLVAGWPVRAVEPVPGNDLASIRAWLLAHNPELQALQADIEAAQARVLPAGALPNPMASVELDDIDRDHPRLSPGQVGSTTYRVKQTLPLWGKRALARDIARIEVSAVEREREAMARLTLAQAEASYVRYWHAREAVATIDRRIALVAQIEEVAGVRYALGVAAQQDSIRAQVERTGMQRERIERIAIRREAISELNAALGRPAGAELAEPDGAPALDLGASSVTEALHRLDRDDHPSLQASTAMADAALRGAELQRRQRFPDLTASVGLMQRGSRVDGYELMFEVEIPFQRRALREREREALARASAAQARLQGTRVELEARLGSAWAQWDSAREQRDLIERTLIPQAKANYESAMTSYQVGQVDFGTLLEALNGWQGAELARVDATRDELVSAAAVRATLGSL